MKEILDSSMKEILDSSPKKKATLKKPKPTTKPKKKIYKSQNGWLASKNRNEIKVKNFMIEGTDQHIAVCTLAAPVLLAFLAELNKIEPINPKGSAFDDWGHHFALIPGQTALSNHASGTACDINATKHIQGSKKSGYTKAQEKEIHALLKKYEVIRWGFDYKYTKDPMHFEINATPAEVKALIAKLQLPKPKIMK